MKPISIEVIAAQPGFLTVHNLEEYSDIVIGEPVVAWRIETYEKSSCYYEVQSCCTPLTVNGDVPTNCIGVQNPNLTITAFDHSTYDSLEELQDTKYPQPMTYDG
ncbi:hypothetical protein C2869_03135 [Saccharobesus litoralis]|uniref:Uncharacterized protein n=1 Tax=Saccharobesus litoralis TaxID=2172099 RepID=A0A2S0VMP8_9ALTE|nr:hypothetical protein [Saccharobesus litoralis]AWB65488.1 hypothetical protein C2869_03135 [Saccharobesus litoralis]